MIKFYKALPIWPEGKEKEMNLSVGFIYNLTVQKACKYKICLTGSTLYRVYINGKFIHYGPARGPHGYVRVDEINLIEGIKEGINTLAIEVAGYNCNSYYTLNVPSFLQVEVYENDEVIGYTEPQGEFKAVVLSSRIQKTMRYSFQRPFSEVYKFDNNETLYNWKTEPPEVYEKLDVINLDLKYLPRQLQIPDYNFRNVNNIIEYGIGQVKTKQKDSKYYEHNFIYQISDQVTGYKLESIQERPFEIVQDLDFSLKQKSNKQVIDVNIEENITEGQYVLFDMSLNNNGFIFTDIVANKNSQVYFLFDEKLINGKLDISSWQSVNIVKYSLAKSDEPYILESFETYGFRYIMCYVHKGSIKLNKLMLKEYSYPIYGNTCFKCNDDKINAIFKASIETYRQNTLDVFMDCPTRERAGWLCDSYFTAQSAQCFSGNIDVEKIFLENFVLAREFPYIPKGMLPMCYPAEHANGIFIPQWAMWYVIELEGYFTRNPLAEKETFRDLCYGLVNYFLPFKNEDGLLEKLDMWNFVEWSLANDWVQDLNYPTNMLYSKMLQLIGNWYEDDKLIQESENVRRAIIEQSFNGELFIDNAIRKENGRLEITNNTSEVCQYYAFFFGVANPDKDEFKGLKDKIIHIFGPDRRAKGVMPEVAYANAFIGNYLRMELLLQWKRHAQVVEEVKSYFYRMAETTGTLWEHDMIFGSLNHGFASFIGVVILKAIFGISKINEREKVVEFDFGDVDIEAEAIVGTSEGDIVLKREPRDGKYKTEYVVPKSFSVKYCG